MRHMDSVRISEHSRWHQTARCERLEQPHPKPAFPDVDCGRLLGPQDKDLAFLVTTSRGARTWFFRNTVQMPSCTAVSGMGMNAAGTPPRPSPGLLSGPRKWRPTLSGRTPGNGLKGAWLVDPRYLAVLDYGRSGYWAEASCIGRPRRGYQRARVSPIGRDDRNSSFDTGTPVTYASTPGVRMVGCGVARRKHFGT